MKHNTVHYQASFEPLGSKSKFPVNQYMCSHLSGGHPEHDYVPGYAWPVIREQFELNPVKFQKSPDEVQARIFDSTKYNLVKLDYKGFIMEKTNKKDEDVFDDKHVENPFC